MWSEVEPALLYHTPGAFDLEDGAVSPSTSCATTPPLPPTPTPTPTSWARPRRRPCTAGPSTSTAGGSPRSSSTTGPSSSPHRPAPRGRRHRYGYGVALADGGDDVNDFAPAPLQTDLDRGRTTEHRFADGSVPGAATFVPAGEGAGEDEGWVLSFVLHPTTDTTELVVLDASDFAGRRVASVRLPARVPVGFHGAWFTAG